MHLIEDWFKSARYLVEQSCDSFANMKLDATAKKQHAIQREDYYSALLHSRDSRQDAPLLWGMFEHSSAFQNNRWNLGFFCVLSICEICFYQRFKASVSPLTQVEHKDKEKYQETDEDSSQSGAQHKNSRSSICICIDETGDGLLKPLQLQVHWMWMKSVNKKIFIPT